MNRKTSTLYVQIWTGMALLWLLALPHLIVWFSVRRTPSSFIEVLTDQLCFELCSIPFLLLIPFKRQLKNWIYSGKASLWKNIAKAMWIVALGSVIVLLIPQCFFWLTQRDSTWVPSLMMIESIQFLPAFGIGIIPIGNAVYHYNKTLGE